MNPHDLSRRDFLKIGGIAVTAASASTISSPTIEAQAMEDESMSEGKVSTLSINHPIETEELQGIQSVFSNISAGIEHMKLSQDMGDLTAEEQTTVMSFNSEVFISRTSRCLDKLMRLQKVYDLFNGLTFDATLRDITQQMIKRDFDSIALPMDLFRNVSNQANDPVSLAKHLLFAKKDSSSEIDVDPLIGLSFYTEPIGKEPWIGDYFDTHSPNPYAITHRFIKNSGEFFDTLAPRFSMKDPAGVPQEKRPDEYITSAYSEIVTSGENPPVYTYKEIKVDNDALEEIYKDLSEIGIERSIARLVFRNDGGNEYSGGYFNPSLPEVDLLLPFSKIDLQTYKENRKAFLFIVLHETFHSLVSRIPLMSDYDACYVYGMMLDIFNDPTINSFIQKKEFHNEKDLELQNTEGNIFNLISEVTNNTNEAFRDRRIMAEIKPNLDFLLGYTLQIYNGVMFVKNKISMDKDLSFWKSPLLRITLPDVSGLPEQERNSILSSAMINEVENIKVAYKENNSQMSNLEKYLCEEVIERSKNGSLYSEFNTYALGTTPVEWCNTYLPAMIMYSAVARNDDRFTNAVRLDLYNAYKEGRISELRMMHFLRSFDQIGNIIKDQWGRTVSLTVEEYLADQFALSLGKDITYDEKNPLSTKKSKRAVALMRSIFRNMMDFFRSRNLAKLETTDTWM